MAPESSAVKLDLGITVGDDAADRRGLQQQSPQPIHRIGSTDVAGSRT
jgi:hypothetical protein